jgi:hypothetical protein
MDLIGNWNRASPAHQDPVTMRKICESLPHDGQHIFVH